ncbi:MAG: hypothetical protein COV29_02090 [Candidatus Yanofskybacteria bacterium CG10_big_fil_rev_8_21_14_0_10_36_16]|uniref:Uncharacterized protein n=1 Tax=Candidatus Yanofskybacteria bacterium CG10_big_fil_rev_8_21_14_0_10_36_16 TaxID=1975096 RepID=A0A2J0Q7J0_9BACT|nr:MAG: hypothetical protein COV29_02090 [Candidatus Yanofskybacteria bacterium CG10_big_fil_rev_8_21_14_0_10_36_16]
MSLLKGNYNLPKKKEGKEKKDREKDKSLEEEFEAAALKKLGGSITFVKKGKGFVHGTKTKENKGEE